MYFTGGKAILTNTTTGHDAPGSGIGPLAYGLLFESARPACTPADASLGSSEQISKLTLQLPTGKHDFCLVLVEAATTKNVLKIPSGSSVSYDQLDPYYVGSDGGTLPVRYRGLPETVAPTLAADLSKGPDLWLLSKYIHGGLIGNVPPYGLCAVIRGGQSPDIVPIVTWPTAAAGCTTVR